MSKTKMRSKVAIEATTLYEDTAIRNSILEALLDIRDILDDRMPKGIEISGTVEEKPNEVTMCGRPVVNVRTGKRVKGEDLEGKVWYIDLKNMKSRHERLKKQIKKLRKKED